MRKTIIINEKMLALNGLKWFQKAGVCSDICKINNEICENRSKNTCINNVMGHCCKHVINGTCKEKESFKKVASINNIPSCVTDEVLEKYIDLSKSVLDSSTAVGLSGFGKKITLCLEGTREYCDYVDYIATEEDNNKIRAGIVSTFVKETHYELYWLLQCLYDKYKMNRDMIVGFDMLPVITESSEEYNGKYSHKLKLEMPYAEKALRRGGYYYIDRREEIKDYSIGCLFDYHITKGIEKAESGFGIYDQLYCYFAEYDDCFSIKKWLKQNRQYIFGKYDKDIEDDIKQIVMYNQQEYQNRMISLYLEMCSEEKLNKDFVFCDSKIKEHYQNNMGIAINPKLSGLDKKIKEYDVCELILLKRLLNRVMSQCKSNIIDTLDKIIDIMEDNENNDSTNVIDFTSFNIVYFISVSTMLLYSFVKLYGKAYGEITENVKELILQWREIYNVLSDIKYESITCWSMRFDELYLLERAREYIDDIFKS